MSIMTIMKKSYIKWLILGILIFGMITLIIILNYQKSKISYFINYPVNYSLCNTTSMDVKIYCNNRNLSFLDKDNIASIYLLDRENNYYKIKLDSILEDKKVLIEDSNYYPYTFKISIPITCEEVLKIDDALLYIVDKRGEEVKFNIGNISMVSGEYFTLVDVKSIVGSTKFIQDYSTLDKIKLELYNFQIYDIVIKDVKLISNILETDCSEIKISPDNILELEIPLTYLENSFIDNVGILLTLEYQGSIYQQIINPYVLFKTSTKHTKPIIQKYEIY